MKNGFEKWMDHMMMALLIIMLAASLLALCGCAGTTKAVTASASGKNLDLAGFVTMGELETANPETATPQGRFIAGRLNYKSRKVGIPADQKVPNSGNFRATKTKSLFGVEEVIIEYDWTAGSDADAKKAEEALKKMQNEAEKKFAEKRSDAETPPVPDVKK
ncbi:MAG: hypothetical protein IJU70_06925 [Lentisphaeria bacterium]|nr:hypothetical protein [Lentisphaeria bacterium]